MTSPLRSLLVLCVGLGLGLGLGACAGELEDPERFADCRPGGVEALFLERCTGDCHAGDRPEAGLDLTGTGPEIAARMIGEVSTTQYCDGRMLVDPEAIEPGDHLLLDKLNEAPACGTRMPFGAESLTDVDRECVRRWVEDALAEAP